MHVVTAVLWFALGITLVLLVFDSALRTFVLPRGATPVVSRATFIGLRMVFNGLARAARTYDGRDSVMALYGPVGLLLLPVVWMVMVVTAYTAMFHALGVSGFERAFEMSGSSLFTLGFVRPPDLPTNILAFLEAATGLGLLGLLIAYLPTIYTAFSRREVRVAQLEVRAGQPPAGVNVLVRAQQMERFHLLDDFWRTWQEWFTELEETHVSIGVLSFFRSPVGHRSWVTASGAVLDAASLRLAAVDLPLRPGGGHLRAGRLLRAPGGGRLLRHPVRPRPASGRRDQHHQGRVPRGVRPAGRRPGSRCGPTVTRRGSTSPGGGSTTTSPLLGLAGFVMVPYAPWSSDRSLRYRRATMRPGRRRPIEPSN